MNGYTRVTFALLLALVCVGRAAAQDQEVDVILFTNVNVFDGANEALIEDADVVVTGNMITAVSTEPLAVAGARVIDGGGRTLIPGLIDAHWHTMLAFWPVGQVLGSDIATLTLAAAKAHREPLLRGFTTVRDAGGATIPIARAVDSGLIEGPRMYPAGPVIGQTGGHGDWRSPLNIPEERTTPLDYPQRAGHTLIADGVPAVLQRSREALRMGATHLKAMAGGGVNSLYDPLDVTQYTPEEARAMVQAASNWNTYVMAHAHNDAAMRQWVEAGAMTIEHGFFMEAETAQMMAERGVWWRAGQVPHQALQVVHPLRSAEDRNARQR